MHYATQTYTVMLFKYTQIDISLKMKPRNRNIVFDLIYIKKNTKTTQQTNKQFMSRGYSRDKATHKYGSRVFYQFSKVTTHL